MGNCHCSSINTCPH